MLVSFVARWKVCPLCRATHSICSQFCPDLGGAEQAAVGWVDLMGAQRVGLADLL